MHLNLPHIDDLLACENLLIAGMGGGYDIFCGLPIYFELRRRGRTVHLANLSFSQTQFYRGGITLTENVVGVTAAGRSVLLYFPEFHLTRWFQETHGEDIPIWCFRTPGGVVPLQNAYQALIAHLNIDGILLIDGGVDSLIRGDEAEVGTILEDAVTLSRISLP